MSIKLGIFVTHPVQYHVPIWRQLAAFPELKVKVHFFSDHSVRGGMDPGFGVPVTWDTPLLEGYEHEFVSQTADINDRSTFVLDDPVKLLREGQFDWVLVAGYTHPFEKQILRAARKLGIKIIMRGEFTDLKKPDYPQWKRVARYVYLRWLYRKVNVFACIGYQARKHLQTHGVASSNIFFSPYSVNNAMFEEQKGKFSREDTRKELGLSDDTFVFLYSGKLIPRKQVKVLVEAFAHLKHPEKAAFLVLGDGEEREEIVERGRELLGDRFLYQGFVNQSLLGQYFLASDAFVLPSDYEAWGLVVNEAMQFGLPLVLSDMIGSHKDLLVSDETGYLFETGNVKSLAQSMDRMMESPQHAKEMGKNALHLVKSYSSEASAQGIREAILTCSRSQ
ncbi:MAG: glycosyltransferase family 1 protein [Deltaproteobacteria bacterium]|nr:MAG: glycosyltransferase family 1 protein [Deltaproteobacteria bacterium]